jgi:hypothetical protein
VWFTKCHQPKDDPALLLLHRQFGLLIKLKRLSS